MPGPTPAILEAAERYRQALLQRERRAATALVRYYGTAWARLQDDIALLQADIAEMRDAGKGISGGRLWRLERMQRIQAQVNQEMARFVRLADDTISAGQREAIATAERDAADLIRRAYPPGSINVSFAAMPRESVQALVGFLQDGSPLVDVLTRHVGDAAQRLGETIVSGLVSGWNPRKLAREMRGSFGMGLTDALRVARTEQLRAYRTATLNSYQANSNVVTGWERLATNDDRTCMACVVLDGKRYKLNEPMDDHVQGRCLTPGQTIATSDGPQLIEDIEIGDKVLTHKGRYRRVTAISARAYVGKVLAIGQGNCRLTVTPEHPLLTQRGWVEAKDLIASDTLPKLYETLVRVSNGIVVNCSPYAGLVYNLQVAEDESYIANGIIVHNCAMIPITRSYAEMGIDAPEPDFQREMAQDWFLRQDEGTQQRMMGRGMFEAWNAGQFDLEDIPKLVESRVWGNSWVPKPLKDLAKPQALAMPARAVVERD